MRLETLFEVIFVKAHRIFRQKIVRHPGIEPGPPRWKRGAIATRLMARSESNNVLWKMNLPKIKGLKLTFF
jgi:hypothetical protein